jgi:hypothetical protein
MTEFTFKELLAPVSMERFFGDDYGRRPVHIPGDAEKSSRVFSWAELNGLMDMTTLWSDRVQRVLLVGSTASILLAGSLDRLQAMKVIEPL